MLIGFINRGNLMTLNKKILAIAIGLSTTLTLTACNDDDDKSSTPEVIKPTPEVPKPEATPNSIELGFLSRYSTGIFAKSAAEIPAFDPASKRAFVVNAEAGVLEVLDLKDPSKPTKITQITVDDIAVGAEVNSVAIHDGIVAIAIQAKNKTDLGFVAFYNAADLKKLSHVQVGALPDMLTFTPDGKTVLVANEAEPSDDYQIDPEGSISIIDVSNLNQPLVKTADFKAFNGQEQQLRAKGIRIFGPNATAAQDFEPEYITITKDGKTAWVSLQENNALAKVDITTAKVTAIYPLGFKDHGLANNGMDVSDVDEMIDGKATEKPAINIKPWANVRGLYMPDAITSYEVAGKTYIVTANEGDARAWGEGDAAYWAGDTKKGFVEEWRVKHLVHKNGFDRRAGDDLPPQLRLLAKGAELNPTNFAYCGAKEADAGACREDFNLGRLNITWTEGYQKNTDGTPKLNSRGNLVYDHLYSYGARSVSIWTENATQTGLD